MKLTIETIGEKEAKVTFEHDGHVFSEIWSRRDDNTGCDRTEGIIEQVEKQSEMLKIDKKELGDLYELLDAISVESFIRLNNELNSKKD